MNLYYELLRFPVFSIEEVNSMFISEKTARAALGKLLKEGLVLKIRNGLYTCLSGENGGPVANRFQIASAISPTSFVSHHTAFEYHGITNQVYYTVYVSSETRFHDFEFDGYKYHFIRTQLQDGILVPQFGGGVKVTDKERAIVDSIKDMNRYSGLEEVLACVLAVNKPDEVKVLRYLDAYDSPFLYQKTGFIFSVFQHELGFSNEFLEACRKKTGKAKRYLTNGMTDIAYAGEWKIVYPKMMTTMKNGVTEDAAVQ